MLTFSDWKVHDWCILDLHIGQITRFEVDYQSFSDGNFTISGRRLWQNFRPLTLENKVIIEEVNAKYHLLDTISGQRGFNYPFISLYFEEISRQVIENKADAPKYWDKINDFILRARNHEEIIDGVPLFRPA